MSGDLDYLWRAVDAAEKALDAGMTEDADRLLGRTLEAIDRELEARGNVAPRAPFEDLLLAGQRARELAKVKREETT